MIPMSDQPVTLAVLTTALAQFHREIILPDMYRLVEDLFERRIKPRFDEIDGHFDTIYHKLDKLETEFELLKLGLARVEARLDRVEQRLDDMDLRFERVESRLESLERQYQDLLVASQRLEERLSRVEKQVDVIVAAQEKEPLRAEVADLRARVDSLQAQVRTLEERLDR